MMASYVGLLRHSFASLATDIGYNEPTITTLLGHKAPSITSRYVHSADAVLLVAADVVANATMSPIWLRIKRNPSCGISAKMNQSCGTNSPLYRCFRPTEIVVLIWLSPSGTSPEMISRVGRNHLLYRCFVPRKMAAADWVWSPPPSNLLRGILRRCVLGLVGFRPVSTAEGPMKTRDDVSAMLRLKALGWGSKRIAVELRCSPGTVRHWSARGKWRPYTSPSRSRKLGGLSDWLREHFRFHAGNTDAVRQELTREKNITVSLHTVERAVAPLWRKFVIAAHPQQASFEWMRGVLQKDISPGALHHEIGDVPGIETLLQSLYDGRLFDRNRSMAVLAKRRGLKSHFVCSFLDIDFKTHRKCLRTLKDGGCVPLFVRQTKSTRKFANKATKQAVFGLLHQPPSNYGINRTTWIMPDLTRLLRETGHPTCSEVIRKITKVAGYRWRKARIVLTSSDPNYIEKLDPFAPSYQSFVRTKPSSR